MSWTWNWIREEIYGGESDRPERPNDPPPSYTIPGMGFHPVPIQPDPERWGRDSGFVGPSQSDRPDPEDQRRCTRSEL